MHRLGRPRLVVGDKLDEYIGVAVTGAMRAQLEGEAERAGYRSLSRFIRERKLAARGPEQR